MPVFISHKKADRNKAIQIADYLRNHQIICYIDELDPSLKTTSDITNSIMQRVKQCTHLMAVVSDNTTESWWVPFEIGVASEASRRICSYRLNFVQLPEYLEKWPILSSGQQLDNFAHFYRQDQSVPLSESRLFKSQSSRTIGTPESFHRHLKASLGQ